MRDILKSLFMPILALVIGAIFFFAGKPVHSQDETTTLIVPSGYFYMGSQASADGFVLSFGKGTPLDYSELYFIDISSGGTVHNYRVKESQ